MWSEEGLFEGGETERTEMTWEVRVMINELGHLGTSWVPRSGVSRYSFASWIFLADLSVQSRTMPLSY